MYSKFTLFFIILFSFFGCNHTQSESVIDPDGNKNLKVINGTEINNLYSPQILKINIIFKDSTSGFCTGTVIGADSVLTAAHCFTDGYQSANISKPTGETVAVNQVMIHPDFLVNKNLGAIFNDVAVVKTSAPLNLPKLGILVSRQVETNELIEIYGFGLDENGTYGNLKTGTMQIDTVTQNHLIATFSSLSNPCNGDSGGPALVNVLNSDGSLKSVSIAGIISSGTLEKCQEGDINLLTNLHNPSVINFITSLVPEVALQ